jgi:hypothetical protein
MPEHGLSCLRNEAATHPRGNVKLVSLAVADQECIKTIRAWGVAGNNKLLPAADAHFHPGAAALAWLIAAVAALGHDTRKALRTYGCHHILGRDGEAV